MRAPRLSLLCLCLAACQAAEGSEFLAPAASGGSPSPTWAAPHLPNAISIRDGRTGARLSFAHLMDELEDADAVFLGETHVDETTHRTELAIYEEWLRRRAGQVVLAMEMFERDDQAALDDYLAGRIEEPEFQERTSPWGQYRAAYRPLVERARAEGLPVIGSNFSRPLLRRIAMEGAEVLESLPPEERAWVPEELLGNTANYRRRADNAVRGHLAMMRRDPDDPERLFGTQTLWDNAMGDACARALQAYPGWGVLHVNGYFHSAHWDGTARQLQLRRPDARVRTVTILPAPNPQTAELSGAPQADFVVFAEARARDRNDGSFAVHVTRELEYRLHLPEGADDSAPLPLLIWLSDDGFGPSEGLALWKERLGDEAAIAVLDAPYRQVERDLAQGGRWYWSDTFAEDMGVLRAAVERTYGYLLRHFPLDPARVALAGEGTGATVAACVGVQGDHLELDTVAISPRQFARLRDLPLPLPIDRRAGEPHRGSLRLLHAEEDADWWRAELEQYAAVEYPTQSETIEDDPWERETQAENALRAALGLDARTVDPGTPRRHVIVPGESPRADLWARLAALQMSAEGRARVAPLPSGANAPVEAAIELQVQPDEHERIPRCPGPFGGTTVLVVDGDLSAKQRAAWRALEEDDPLAASSRFHRVRVALTGEERDLPAVLEELLGQGRKSVLIVPAEFCADADRMGRLERAAAEFADAMNLHWMPGLGGPRP